MGTYLRIKLKSKKDDFIKMANESLQGAGYPNETINGIDYGFFPTLEQLREDARFMNEEPEGLKQAPHFERPITPEFLQTFFWNVLGEGTIKVSGCDDEQQEIVNIVKDWTQTGAAQAFIKEVTEG